MTTADKLRELSEKASERPWTNYADQKPDAGLFEWRIPSVSLPGEHVIVASMMRQRGAGWSDPVLSPAFDHWDGYRVHVPNGLQWRSARDSERKVIHADLICVEGLEHLDCIYCGKRPTLHGCQRSGDGRGVIVNGDPWRFNSWWLSCCRWGDTPHIDDPREIERIRRAAITCNTAPALARDAQKLQRVRDFADGMAKRGKRPLRDQPANVSEVYKQVARELLVLLTPQTDGKG